MAEEGGDAVQVSVPADEAGQAIRQVATGLAFHPQGREGVTQARDADLPEDLGAGHATQPVAAQADQADAIGERIGDEGGRRVGHDDLAAVASGRHACGPVHLEAAVIVAGEVGLAAVQAHPDLHADTVRPRSLRQGPLRIDGGGYGSTGLGERGEQAVALGAHHVSIVGGDRLPKEAMVPGHDVVPGASQAPCRQHRILDVGAQERDGPGRQCALVRDAVGHPPRLTGG